MRYRVLAWTLRCVVLLGIAALTGGSAADPTGVDVSVEANTKVVPRYEVFELTFHHDRRYDNPFFDVSIDASFTSPSGTTVTVGGFHYGSSEPPEILVTKDANGRRHVDYRFTKQDVWKARFAPWETGEWTYTALFRSVHGEKSRSEGSFRCIVGRMPNPGFVRRSRTNPFRWVFDDGSPFFPVGLQECIGDGDGTGTILDGASLEGPFRTDRTDLVELPPGPLYVRGPSENPQNMDVYFRRYAQSGFNLFRFSQANCSYSLYRDLDHYSVQEGVMTDELLRHVRKYGQRVFYGIFGYQGVFAEEPQNAEGMEKVERFIQYSVNRWGAYVDFWEFLNEQKADNAWYDRLIPFLASIDPYHHPITTSWERPEIAGIEVNAPHWYQNEDERRSDEITAARATEWKKRGKPVIVGEQGNYVDPKSRPIGVGGVWDFGSARRMRLRLWSAFFNEIAFVFWNTSYARDGHFMNQWLGPHEREYVRALQSFSYALDGDIAPVGVTVSEPDSVRAYGLASPTRAGVYLHHFADHDSSVKGLRVTLDVPADAVAYWYSPETAAIFGREAVREGGRTLTAPDFVVDLALLVTPDSAPDVDGDGLANDIDPDDDNDGVPDASDAFPLDPSEWADADGDLIGDVLDADDDGDGVGDDHNENGAPDHEERDFDGDGVKRAEAVPWDAFPNDPKEWRDADGDGIGDNADLDNDGDGWSDAEEADAGTDSQNALSFPTERDVDATP